MFSRSEALANRICFMECCCFVAQKKLHCGEVPCCSCRQDVRISVHRSVPPKVRIPIAVLWYWWCGSKTELHYYVLYYVCICCMLNNSITKPWANTMHLWEPNISSLLPDQPVSAGRSLILYRDCLWLCVTFSWLFTLLNVGFMKGMK